MGNTGQRIKDIRKYQNLTQLQLANQVGVSRSHIAKIETGETNGSIPLIQKLAKVLNISVSELIEDQKIIT